MSQLVAARTLITERLEFGLSGIEQCRVSSKSPLPWEALLTDGGHAISQLEARSIHTPYNPPIHLMLVKSISEKGSCRGTNGIATVSNHQPCACETIVMHYYKLEGKQLPRDSWYRYRKQSPTMRMWNQLLCITISLRASHRCSYWKIHTEFNLKTVCTLSINLILISRLTPFSQQEDQGAGAGNLYLRTGRYSTTWMGSAT